VEHGGKVKSASTERRSLSIALLVVHLAVLLFGGGALASENAARAAARRAFVTAATGANDGSVVVTVDGARLEPATRPRADTRRSGTDRGTGPASLDAILPRAAVPAIGPADVSAALAFCSVSNELRSRPSLVNGARGPPTAL
jgi:hypothetical protein